MRSEPGERDLAGDRSAGLRPPLDAVRLLVESDGFLTWIEQSNLLEVAVDEDRFIQLDAYLGSFLVKGTSLGAAWPADGGRFDEKTADRIADRIPQCIHTGFERTAPEDALVNISALLCDLSDRDLGVELLRDEDDRVRVTLRRPGLATYVDLGLSQPRRYGATDPQVLEKIYQIPLDLSHRVTPDERPVVHDQVEWLRTSVGAQSFDSEEQTALAELAHRIEQNLQGRLLSGIS